MIWQRLGPWAKNILALELGLEVCGSAIDFWPQQLALFRARVLQGLGGTSDYTEEMLLGNHQFVRYRTYSGNTIAGSPGFLGTFQRKLEYELSIPEGCDAWSQDSLKTEISEERNPLDPIRVSAIRRRRTLWGRVAEIIGKSATAVVANVMARQVLDECDSAFELSEYLTSEFLVMKVSDNDMVDLVSALIFVFDHVELQPLGRSFLHNHLDHIPRGLLYSARSSSITKALDEVFDDMGVVKLESGLV